MQLGGGEVSWKCNYCGHRVEPVKEVEDDGADWPAGRACSRCLNGEMVCRPEKAVCDECDGEGRVRVGERLVSREMALDAGDRTLEGSRYEYDYVECAKCDGRGFNIQGEHDA